MRVVGKGLKERNGLDQLLKVKVLGQPKRIPESRSKGRARVSREIKNW